MPRIADAAEPVTAVSASPRAATCYPSAVNRFGEVTAKVDAFFARVEARHAPDMACGTGCSDCCRVQLSITGVEAAAIRALVAGWSVEQRRALAVGREAHGLSPGPGACAALDASGRCRIYAARPLVCRSHGAPIRLRESSLPVVRSCFRNFTHTEPDADCVLDQETLSALLLAVDRDAGGDGSRIDLASLVGELAI